MLDIKIDGDNVKVQHRGDPLEIAIETSIAINMMYTAFLSESEAAAKMFQYAITGCMTPDAPTWNADKNQITIKMPIKKGGAPTGQSQSTAD